jgi:hypothetical protein
LRSSGSKRWNVWAPAILRQYLGDGVEAGRLAKACAENAQRLSVARACLISERHQIFAMIEIGNAAGLRGLLMRIEARVLETPLMPQRYAPTPIGRPRFRRRRPTIIGPG